MVTLMICDNNVQAHLMKGALESEGIQAFIANEHFNAVIPGYNNMGGIGIRLMVDDPDVPKAIEILTAYFPQQIPGAKLKCPECGSEELTTGQSNESAQKFAFVVMSLLTATPMNNIQGNLRCKACGTVF